MSCYSNGRILIARWSSNNHVSKRSGLSFTLEEQNSIERNYFFTDNKSRNIKTTLKKPMLVPLERRAAFYITRLPLSFFSLRTFQVPNNERRGCTTPGDTSPCSSVQYILGLRRPASSSMDAEFAKLLPPDEKTKEAIHCDIYQVSLRRISNS